jgi:hypothetical protein
MEVLFQAINKDELIDQVILIGDAAPNTPEPYWNNNGFPATNMSQ